MQVKSIAERPKRALPFVFKTFVLSIFEWPLKTCFTVHYTAKFIYSVPGIPRNGMFSILHRLTGM